MAGVTLQPSGGAQGGLGGTPKATPGLRVSREALPFIIMFFFLFSFPTFSFRIFPPRSARTQGPIRTRCTSLHAPGPGL